MLSNSKSFKFPFTIFAAVLLSFPLVSLGQSRPAALTNSPASNGPSASAIGSIGGLTDQPISPGEVVHITVFDAPDFSETTRVSESGDVGFPMLGIVHLGGLNSASAGSLIAAELKNHKLMQDPHVMVTVDSSSTGITILGEVRAPGIYPPLGKHTLSDLLAAAGGMTSSTGRVIEISNDHTPEKKVYLPWDPTMHNTGNYDHPIAPGDRVIVRGCGFIYVGGNVVRPGAYSLCGSAKMTLSAVMALAGGIAPFSSPNHTYLVRAQPDGTRVVQEINLPKVLRDKAADPIVHEDDILFVSPSPIKAVLNRALGYAVSLAGPLVYLGTGQ